MRGRNYYTEGERVRGEWQGKLAEHFGLRGDVKRAAVRAPV